MSHRHRKMLQVRGARRHHRTRKFFTTRISEVFVTGRQGVLGCRLSSRSAEHTLNLFMKFSIKIPGVDPGGLWTPQHL